MALQNCLIHHSTFEPQRHSRAFVDQGRKKFIRRADFGFITTLSVREKADPDRKFTDLLPLIAKIVNGQD